MKVLVVQQRYGIGDMVIFSPYIQAISNNLKTSVTLLAKKSSRARDLFAYDKSVDEIIDLDKSLDKVSGFLKLSNVIRQKKFDKIFIFNGSLRYRILSSYVGIKAIYQYPLFTSKDVIFQTAKIFTENIFNHVISSEPKLEIDNLELDKYKKKYNFDINFKHIILGVSASGPTKRWDIDNFIKLARKIKNKKKCKFYLAGGLDDKHLINKFISSGFQDCSFSLENLQIKEIMHVIKNSDLYIGNDTGFMHISAGLGLKCIGLFFDSPAFSYSGYTKKIEAITPLGKTIYTTTHNTNGKDRISFEEVVEKTLSEVN